MPTNREVTLDSMTVYGPSVTVRSDSARHSFNSHKNSVTVYGPGDSVQLCYRVFPFSLHKINYNLDVKRYDAQQYFSTREQQPLDYSKKPMLEKEELFSFNDFNKSGNFTRGVSVGNAQNAFVNSSLNLQLDGYLTQKIKLTGAISDQNMPIQPNGYTQNLQQFDRVYLQLEQQGLFKVIAGDYVLKNREESYFLRYLKNVQGLQGHYYYKMGLKDTAHTTAGISFGKGKFSSMELLGSGIASANAEQVLQEGMLGPYRLIGPNRERFVQVIANSEKIYLDGQPLTRGFNNDYTIDYNSGEVRFTARVLITKYSR
ncbi:MAG TPA: hypothetical protein VL947_10455, partial [Cytophagales bacterium]|nr:hypothetical protein [Cytophagales bacterium]